MKTQIKKSNSNSSSNFYSYSSSSDNNDDENQDDSVVELKPKSNNESEIPLGFEIVDGEESVVDYEHDIKTLELVEYSDSSQT